MSISRTIRPLRMIMSAAICLLFAACLLLGAAEAQAASIRVVPSADRISAGDSFFADIVAEGIPAGGLGAFQFRLNISASGSNVVGIADTALGAASDVSVSAPLLIGPSVQGRSGLGQFFLNASGPHGLLVMDNGPLNNGTALFTVSHTNGAAQLSGGGTIARFYISAGNNVATQQISITLSEVVLLDADTVFSLDSNTGAVIDLAINTAPADVTNATAADKPNDESGRVILSWSPSSSTDTAGYKVYLVSGTQSLLKTTISNPGAAGAEIAGLPNAQVSQLKITVIDTFGNESQGVIVSATPLDDVAPTVQASPAGGAFSTTVNVTLQSNEPASIYHTTDGSIPTVNSPRYSLPLAISETKTLKFMAIDTAGNSSAFRAETYTIRSNTISINLVTSKGRLLSGIKVYAFKENGSYTNVSATTDAGGNALFNVGAFTSGNYKFRVDYLGYQFWSAVMVLPGASAYTVVLAEETVEVLFVPAASGVKIYLFTEAGAYQNKYGTTDSSGKTTFDLPVGKNYKFRGDYLGSQYWSPVTTVVAGTNAVRINVGGGMLQATVQKDASRPLGSVATYLFNQAGTYLNRSQTTDSTGVVKYDVASGTFKVRADYLGYQFWTVDTPVSANTNIILNIPHRPVVFTANGLFQGTNTALQGLSVYLFNSKGSYLNQSQGTNSSGQVIFDLPEKEHKARVDYMGQQFWSQGTTWQDTTVNIPMADAKVRVIGHGSVIQGVKVYVFSASGPYLNVSAHTDANGDAGFRLPAGTYRFRADYQAKQFWSSDEQLSADELNQVVISTGGGAFTLKVMKTAALPLTGVKCYVFNEGGPYLSIYGVTDDLGEVTFDLADGVYQFRIDYLGYKFWSELINVPQTLQDVILMDNRDVTISVTSKLAADIQPVPGVKVYLFNPTGSYLSLQATTDANGQVFFSLPCKDYTVRVDYMGQQFWSGTFNGQNTEVVIPEGTAHLHVHLAGHDIAGEKVYVYDANGSYLGLTGTTDASGVYEFRLPAASYTFRADYQGQQFRVSAGVSADVVNNIEIVSAGAEVSVNVNSGSGPLTGVRVYVFSSTGSYLGIYAFTNETGAVSYNLVDGGFKFRVDYLGYQYWSNVITVPATTDVTVTIPHRNTEVLVQGALGQDILPIGGLPVYLFSPSGSYIGIKKNTDAGGQAYFSLPNAEYKVRTDYLGKQFWSGVFRFTDAPVTIDEGIVRLSVHRGIIHAAGVRVYLFNEGGSYLGEFANTDTSGAAEFRLPARNFKFRIDEGVNKFWTGVLSVLPGQTNALDIDLNTLEP